MSTDTDDTYEPNCESYQEYRSRINTMADVIEDDLENDPTLTVSGMVFEEVDASRFAIYTHEAINALKHCDNDPREWHHLVAEDATWSEAIRTMAFDAVRWDLYDELRRRDVDV
jgi:hypothetical protein